MIADSSEVEQCIAWEIKRQGGESNLNSLLSVAPQIRRLLRDVRLIDFVRSKPKLFELVHLGRAERDTPSQVDSSKTAWLIRSIGPETDETQDSRGILAMVEHKRMQALQRERDIRVFLRRLLLEKQASCGHMRLKFAWLACQHKLKRRLRQYVKITGEAFADSESKEEEAETEWVTLLRALAIVLLTEDNSNKSKSKRNLPREDGIKPVPEFLLSTEFGTSIPNTIPLSVEDIRNMCLVELREVQVQVQVQNLQAVEEQNQNPVAAGASAGQGATHLHMYAHPMQKELESRVERLVRALPSRDRSDVSLDWLGRDEKLQRLLQGIYTCIIYYTCITYDINA